MKMSNEGIVFHHVDRVPVLHNTAMAKLEKWCSKLP